MREMEISLFMSNAINLHSEEWYQNKFVCSPIFYPHTVRKILHTYLKWTIIPHDNGVDMLLLTPFWSRKQMVHAMSIFMWGYFYSPVCGMSIILSTPWTMRCVKYFFLSDMLRNRSVMHIIGDGVNMLGHEGSVKYWSTIIVLPDTKQYLVFEQSNMAPCGSICRSQWCARQYIVLFSIHLCCKDRFAIQIGDSICCPIVGAMHFRCEVY